MTGDIRSQMNLISAGDGPSFTHDGRDVFWGTVRLRVSTVEHLLTVFDNERAVRPYLELHDAYVATGGVPRVSCYTDMRSAA